MRTVRRGYHEEFAMSGKSTLLCLLAALLLAATVSPALAATIYGSLTENQRPVAGRPMQLLCQNRQVGDASTDARGSYRFTVNAGGGCEVQVDGLRAPVILSATPAQYNFELRAVNGRRALAQR
jgi:hypothetical protein